jgi:hypothetical protein
MLRKPRISPAVIRRYVRMQGVSEVAMKKRLFWNALMKTGKPIDNTNGRLSLMPHGPFWALLFLGLISFSSRAAAPETPAVPDTSRNLAAMHPAATLAIFHDRPMPDGLMPALVTALRSELASGSPELSILLHQPSSASGSAQVEILAGEEIAPGMSVQNPVTVYLHGECKPIPQPPIFTQGLPPVSGVLGWVVETNGHIDPFVHVACSRLSAMLAAPAYGRSYEQRNQMMAVAVSKVILHEWIHIATQSPHHAHEGIGKAAFSVNDLLAIGPGRLAHPEPPSTVLEPGFFARMGPQQSTQPQHRSVR